ncbi:MAG TPA: type II toxin-antitoxin system HipA family toxin [Saprospiraceae bacterium]|nr:type II toxin-antitoxin system HipA family toxin [Saprospiraceae bacterium]HRG22039.1 type II toxin-antitoxin system HipA family toxin [Saprospiraceae bacterium]
MIVEVFLYGQSLGTAEWNSEKKSSIFQYSSQIIGKVEPSPIIMPTEARIFETNRDHANFHDLPYLLSDSLPDDFGNAMMKAWLKQRDLSIDDISPVDRLTYVGNRGMGALQYLPINYKADSNYKVDVGQLLEVAKRILEDKKETSYNGLDNDSLTDILRIGTSVGGARAKALIAIKKDQDNKIEEIRPGDIIQPPGYSYWLLKMDGANKQSLGEGEGMGKIEFAYYKLAKEAGIEMAESILHEENNRFHFLTKRFDRTDNGEKIHMQTFGSLTGIDYKIPKASSYEVLFRTMKRLQLPYNQYEQQYRRMLFNVIARNHDDHVKNFSFLMPKDGKWKISPAYDLCYSYSPGGNWTSVHQSSINNKYDNFTKDDLLEFAKTFGIKKANDILQEVIAAVSQWNKIAAELEIPKKKINDIHNNLRIKSFT